MIISLGSSTKFLGVKSNGDESVPVNIGTLGLKSKVSVALMFNAPIVGISSE